MTEKLQIIVNTIHGKKELDIYSPDFTWRNIVFPPITSIVVKQGHHSAEIGEYQQYNFMLEVIQQLAGFGNVGSDSSEISRFWIMGNMDMKVDLYIFDCYKGVISRFSRDTQPWGAELDGASTTGWKLGVVPENSPIISG